MVNTRCYAVSAIGMALVIIIAAGCKETPTEEAFEPKLLLSTLSVAVVPEGTEEVMVTATDEQNSPRPFAVSCDNEAVATVTKADSTITITGLSYGTANVTVTSDTNIRILPIKVYDPKILEAGELLIAFVDEFEYRWCSIGAADTWDASFYHPATTDGYHALGTLGIHEFSDPNGAKFVVVVKAQPGSDALQHPVDYDSVWNTRGSGIHDNGSLWNPVPPPGYKALGTVAQQGYGKPSLDDVVCVREDLTIPGERGPGVFWGENSSAECEAYTIIPPIVDNAHDSCYLATGAFTGTRTRPDSTGHPALHVLKVKLPKVTEAPDQDFAPRLTGYDVPVDTTDTDPVMSKEILVPWTIVKDAQHSEIWRYANSPNYRVERQVFYRRKYHRYNQSSTETVHDHWTKTVGLKTTESETYKSKTGLSLAATYGCSFGCDYKMFNGEVNWSITATVSVELGYEKQYGLEEFEETSVDVEVAIPPGKAAAVWQKYNRFIVTRHNAKHREPVAQCEFGIDSYVSDEFPHGD